MSKTLIIAEKPSAGMDYAKVLNCNNRKNGYIEGNFYIVIWAYSHLFTLKEPGDYNSKYDKWTFEDLPIIPDNFQIKLNKAGKDQFPLIKKLVNRSDVTEIINGGDAGREGELIQRYIINKANINNKPVKRLWINSLTKEDIKKGFNSLKPQSEYDNLYYSAKARTIIDWLIGINYTRAYSTKNKGNKPIIVGRVQTAILSLISKREQEIDNFEPVKYNQVIADFKSYKGKYFDKDNNTKIFDKKLTKKIKKQCLNNKGKIIDIEKTKKYKSAPKLFNLTGLQKRMNKKYGYSAQKTLDIAQKLYEEHKILSYPRTDSKYLGNTHKKEIPNILEKLSNTKHKKSINKLNLSNLNFSKKFINDEKITDHHAIIPTTKNNIAKVYKTLNKKEKQLFDEVILRLISQFYKKYSYTTTTVITDVSGYMFQTKGKIINEPGWKVLYPDKQLKDDSLPELKKGEIFPVIDIIIENKKTKPPKHFTENTLLGKLEKYNIGTEATRAGMIEKLIYRKYIKRNKKNLLSTTLGQKIINTIITDKLKKPELTGELENKLQKVRQGNKPYLQLVSEQSKIIREEINNIGSTTIEIFKEKDKPICACPKCNGDTYKRKGFYGCSNWNNEDIKCDFTINRISKKMLTENQVKRLCKNGETKFLRGFKSKKGNKFKAKLKLNDNYKIEFIFPNKKQSKIKCPICNGKMIDKGKFYGCSNYKEKNCKFTVSKRIAGKKITKKILKNLCHNKETNILKGFKSKKGNKFKAKLVLEDNNINFSF
mgnify:CR=1 FL=1